MKPSVAAVAVVLSACASPPPPTFPDGAVKTQAQAEAVAEQGCGTKVNHAGDSIHARLDGADWIVWWGPEDPNTSSIVQTTIDARSGKEKECLVRGIPNIDPPPGYQPDPVVRVH